MCFEVVRSREEHFAIRARVRLFPCVDPHMLFKVTRLTEELVAIMARIRFLPCVDPLMCFKAVVKTRKKMVVVRTLVWFLPEMGFLMSVLFDFLCLFDDKWDLGNKKTYFTSFPPMFRHYLPYYKLCRS